MIRSYLPHSCIGPIVKGFGRGSKDLGCPTGKLVLEYEFCAFQFQLNVIFQRIFHWMWYRNYRLTLKQVFILVGQKWQMVKCTRLC